MMVWNQASADPIRAAEALIKLEAREARLLGLDMPTKVAITDPDGGIPLESVRRVLERLDAETVDVTPESAPPAAGDKRMMRAIEATAFRAHAVVGIALPAILTPDRGSK
jgi:hypothetical protein